MRIIRDKTPVDGSQKDGAVWSESVVEVSRNGQIIVYVLHVHSSKRTDKRIENMRRGRTWIRSDLQSPIRLVATVPSFTPHTVRDFFDRP